MTEPTTASSTEQLSELLAAGAQLDGRPTMQAAIHLLVFTGLPRHRDFAQLIEFDNDDDPQTPPTAAFVRDWTALTTKTGKHLGGADRQLLNLAASMAVGEPTDLRAALPGLGSAYARRAIEAVIIATGTAELYQLTGTPALDQLLADRAAMLA